MHDRCGVVTVRDRCFSNPSPAGQRSFVDAERTPGVTTCPHCERFMDSAPDACDRCGMKFWQPEGALGPTYSVVGYGVAAIVAMWVVAFGRPIWLVYRARSGSASSVGPFASFMTVAELAAVVLVIVWLWRAMRNTEAFPGGGDGIGADW